MSACAGWSWITGKWLAARGLGAHAYQAPSGIHCCLTLRICHVLLASSWLVIVWFGTIVKVHIFRNNSVNNNQIFFSVICYLICSECLKSKTLESQLYIQSCISSVLFFF